MKKLMLTALAFVLAVALGGVYIALAILFVNLLAHGVGILFMTMGAGEVVIATAYTVSIIVGMVISLWALEYLCKRFVAKRDEPIISGE